MKHSFVLLIFLFSFSELAVAQTQETTKITATLVKLNDSTIAVDFEVLAGANLSGSALPISVFLRIPTSLGPTAGTITLASSNFGLQLAQATDDGAGYFIYYYEGLSAINLSSSTWDDGMVVRIGVFNVIGQPSSITLVGGQYGGPTPNGSGGYTWPGTALLTNNTETNLVTWPIAELLSLPIRLTNFTLIKAANSTRIDWTTLSELNSDHFDIQRSYNTKEWTTIGTVAAAGSSSTKKTYSYLDQNLSTKNRIIYYRIKSVDLSRFFTFTETKSIQFGHGPLFKLMNTLVKDRLIIEYDGVEEQLFEFRILNIQGRIMSISKLNLAEGNGKHDISVGIANLPVGIYHVVSSGPKQQPSVLRFIKLDN